MSYDYEHDHAYERREAQEMADEARELEAEDRRYRARSVECIAMLTVFLGWLYS